MRSSTLAIGLCIFAAAGIVLADIAPVPFPQPEPPNPDAPAFQLSRATVVATIRMAGSTSQPAGVAADAQPAPDRQHKILPAPATAPENFVQADVTCDFELACTKAKPGGESVDIAFPVDFLAARSARPQVTRFTVETDGKSVAVEPLLTWNAGPGSPNYFGYRWKANAVAGQTMKFKVSYTMLLPVRGGRARFVYVLRSGATWGSPIKHETVTVKPEGVTLRSIIARGRPEPEMQQDGSMVWTLKDATPAWDINLMVQPAQPSAAVIRSILN